jgi:hypothetical protein
MLSPANLNLTRSNFNHLEYNMVIMYRSLELCQLTLVVREEVHSGSKVPSSTDEKSKHDKEDPQAQDERARSITILIGE